MTLLTWLFAFSFPTFAADPVALQSLHDWFSASACAQLLLHKANEEDEVLAKADEVARWVTLRHPVVRALLARDASSVDRFYELLFLSTGLMIPAAPDGRFRAASAANQRYDALVRFEQSKKSLSSAKGREALGRAFPTTVGWAQRWTKEKREAFLANLIVGSLTALNQTTLAWNRYGASNDTYRSIRFQSPNFHPHLDHVTKSEISLSFHVNWGANFSIGELESLSRTLGLLNDERVRAIFAQRIETLLPDLVRETRTLCERWNACTDLEAAREVLAEIKKDDRGGESNPTRITSTTFPVTTRRFIPLVGAEPEAFEAAAIRDFVSAHPRREGKLDSVVTAMREVKDATDLLIRALFQLQTWRILDVDWSAARAGLQPTRESVLDLGGQLSTRHDKMTDALAELEKGLGTLEVLATWTKDMREFMAGAQLKTRAPWLSGPERAMLRTVLSMIATLDRLLVDAAGAIGDRQTRVTDALDAIFKLHVVIAKIGEGLVRTSGALVQMEDLEAFNELRGTLDDLVRAPR